MSVRSSHERHWEREAMGEGEVVSEAKVRSGARPRMLFLCQTLPYPPDGGVAIRTYNVLRLLAREFDITALYFFRRAERPSPAHVAESREALRAFGSADVYPIPQEHSRRRLVLDHARSLLWRRPYTVYAYESSAFASRLRTLLAQESFDVVHMDSLDLSGYLPLVIGLPVVCVHHNVESSLLCRRASTEGPMMAAYLRLQASLTADEERRWCPRVAVNVTVSEADRQELTAAVPDAWTIVVPNGVDTSAFVPGYGPQEGIVFVGGYSWQPNRDAMIYFAEEVLPLLRSRGIEAPVTWIGRAPEAAMREFDSRFGIRLTGYVDDIRTLVNRAACYVAPLRAGGGTRLKILDAWAMGKAVVSTTVGCEGLDARDGENILVRDSASDFADGVAEILGDHGLRDRIGKAARRTVVERYDWEVIASRMLPAYRQVLGRDGRPHLASSGRDAMAGEIGG